MLITLLGDVHGNVSRYLQTAIKSDASIQLGDFGFSEHWSQLNEVDAANHIILGGNHDDYDFAPHMAHYMGDWGMRKFHEMEFFFVRGALSVDKQFRTPGVDWWPEEELGYRELSKALDAYVDASPDIVLSHDCPMQLLNSFITNDVKYSPSTTSRALGAMFDEHQPKLWVFGHHHRTEVVEFRGTMFVCLDELDVLLYDTDKSLEENIEAIETNIYSWFSFTQR